MTRKRKAIVKIDDYGYAVEDDEFDLRDEFSYYREPPMRQAPPPKPTAEEIADDFNDRLYQTTKRHTIRYNSPQELLSAVSIFGGGPSLTALKTMRDAAEETSNPGMATGLMLLAGFGRSNDDFLNRLLKEIDSKITQPVAGPDTAWANRPVFHGSWDYDGPGAFHKCSLNAVRIGTSEFDLSLYAAYIGNQQEFTLAEQTGARVGFHYTEVNRSWISNSSTKRFRVPLADFAKLYAVLGVDFDAKSFVSTFTTPRREHECDAQPSHDFTPIRLAVDGINVIIGVTDYKVSSPHIRRRSNLDDEYRVEDDCLTGPARIDDRYGLAYAFPVEVTIMGPTGLSFDPAVEKACLDLAEKIQRAWA